MSRWTMSLQQRRLAITAGILLLTCTVAFWVMATQGGRLMHENRVLRDAVEARAPLPQWADISEARAMQQSLKAYLAASAGLSSLKEGRLSFIAPNWATVTLSGDTALLRWKKNGDKTEWILLDRQP